MYDSSYLGFHFLVRRVLKIPSKTKPFFLGWSNPIDNDNHQKWKVTKNVGFYFISAASAAFWSIELENNFLQYNLTQIGQIITETEIIMYSTAHSLNNYDIIFPIETKGILWMRKIYCLFRWATKEINWFQHLTYIEN